MPEFTIETTYHLPIYRHAAYVADTVEAACRLAIDDQDWSGRKEDRETAGETFVTGIWHGADTAHRGPIIPIPPHFEETIQRQAAHFEMMLGLLKIMVGDELASRATSSDWVLRASQAIDMGEAILAGARGPNMRDDPPSTDADRTAPLTQDELDDLLDDANHAVNNLIPDHVLTKLSDGERSTLLHEINDALTTILGEYVPTDL